MPTPEEIRAQINDTSKIVENTLKSVAAQIGDIFQDALSEADSITKIFGKDVEKQLKSLARSTDKMIENQIRINEGQASSKDIAKQLIEYETKRAILEKRIANLMGEQPELANQLKRQLDDVDAANQDYINGLKEQEKELKRIEDKMGVLGKLVKGLNKIPILGNLIEADKVENAMKKAAANGTSPFIAGFKAIGKSIKSNLLDPLTLITFFISKALEANKQTVELGKALGASSEQYRENLVKIESSSSNINVTTANLAEAFNELTQATGFAYEFTADQLETQIKLTKQVGLQADEAAQIQRFAIVTGKTSEETYRSFVRGLTAARNQLKVGINFKAALAEASKVSGQLAANLGNNPETIAKAVVTAKAFGMTLEQVAAAGDKLLDFGSSIESELKAELLLGKQINLERARAAALAGDQVTLAEELSKNVGTAAEFTKLNRLQQNALAESVGMTADALAETLRKREEAIASGKSLAQVTEEEARQALERQTIQDQFNQSILKLQSLIGNLLAGPLGGFLDILVKILNVVNLILQPFTLLANFIKESNAASLTFLGTLGAIYAIKNKSLLIDRAQVALEGIKKIYNATQIGQLGLIEAIKSKGFFKTLADAAMTAFKSVAAIPYVGPILGATAAASAVALGMKLFNADDLMSEGGYGKRTLLAPEGAFKLNDNDTIIAGTNLGGGGGGTIMPSIDLTPMIAAINEVKASVDRLYNKDTSINMDGKKVGSTLVQGTYKVA